MVKACVRERECVIKSEKEVVDVWGREEFCDKER